jgi:hypothetical protein
MRLSVVSGLPFLFIDTSLTTTAALMRSFFLAVVPKAILK